MASAMPLVSSSRKAPTSLKVMATGGSTLGTDPFRPAFSYDELKTIAQEGHRRDRRVVGALPLE